MTNISKSKYQLFFFVILTLVWIVIYAVNWHHRDVMNKASDDSANTKQTLTNQTTILNNQSQGISNQNTIIKQQNIIISNQNSTATN